MTEHDGVAHLKDTDTALRREVDIIAERFPNAGRKEIDRLVHTSYTSLLRDAEIEAHVLSLVRGQVVNQLHQQGYKLHAPALPAD